MKPFVLYFKNPILLMSGLAKCFPALFPDKLYLRLLFKDVMGYSLDLKKPMTFNEKLNWLKLYDHNPEYTKLVDKDSVKSFVRERVGDELVIPTIGKWKSPEEIDFDSLPIRFVLKTTHGGGNEGVIICRDKENFNKKEAIIKLRKSMKQDIYMYSREWPYKDIDRQIICEPYLEDNETGELRDYKFFCFDGKVKALFVATERQRREEPFFNFFDENYNCLDIRQGHPRANIPPAKPELFDEMKNVAQKLSLGFPHVRVDLYQANKKIYFGELTFYHFGGLVPFDPIEWDYKFGDWLSLSKHN